MKQSEIEEMIDESFNYLIDTIINFPENPYHINFEKIFFRGKANLIHKFEKIIEKKDKQIDLMAEYIDEIDVSEDICEGKTMCDENCQDCIKQYFAGLVEKE